MNPSVHRRVLRALRTMILALPIALLVGCVHQSTNGSEVTFRYELWAPICVLLGGIVAVPAGWVARKQSARIGWALLILGPMAALLLAPAMFGDRVLVDDQAFHVRVGIMSATAVHDVKFDDIRGLRITSEVSGGRRKQTNYYFVCDLKSGGTAKVPMSGALTKAAAGLILEHLHARGIPISDET